MSGPLLEVIDLDGGYEPVQVFRGVNLTLPQDASVGLFGPNGHGKSTLLRTISGLIDPWRGDVVFDGQRPQPPSASAAAGAGGISTMTRCGGDAWIRRQSPGLG